MKQVDFIVVGCGLAGIPFCEKLRENHKTFLVYDNASQQSSLAAAGLYNPVILKRFTPVWKIKEQLEIALPMYAKIESELNIKIDYRLKIYRRLASIEEQNLWFNALDKPALEDFMSPKLVKNSNPLIEAQFNLGEVLQAGRLDTAELLYNYKEFLKMDSRLLEEAFEYDALKFSETGLLYKNVSAKFIIFAEGFGVLKNPFFKMIPLNGTKGEVLTVRIPDLKIDYAVKSSVFIIPIGNDLYNVGSTYNWDDKTNQPTDSGKEELLTKLKTFVKAEVKVVDHVAGIRPTVKDRRPLVGQHPKHRNLFMLNGLGTRGVLIGPYVAKKLYDFITTGQPIDDEINITRFLKTNYSLTRDLS